MSEEAQVQEEQAQEKPARELSLADRILGADTLREKLVHVDEWGVDVLIRELTAKEQDEFNRMQDKIDGDKPLLQSLRAQYVAKCMYDPKTKRRVVLDHQVETFSEQSSRVIQRLYYYALKLNTVDGDEIAKIAKNFESEAVDGSSST